jgi:hypothetical protein
VNQSDIPAGPGRVALNQLAAGKPPGLRRDGAYRFPPRFGVVRLRPVAKEQAEVYQRVADGAHLPVENRHYARWGLTVEHHIVEFEVIVDYGGRRRLGDPIEQPLDNAFQFRDLAGFRAFPPSGPSSNLPFDKPGRLADLVDAAGMDVDVVESRQGVDHRFAHSTPHRETIAQLRRNLAPDDQPSPAFHQVEGPSDDARVLAHEIRAGRKREERIHQR